MAPVDENTDEEVSVGGGPNGADRETVNGDADAEDAADEVCADAGGTGAGVSAQGQREQACVLSRPKR